MLQREPLCASIIFVSQGLKPAQIMCEDIISIVQDKMLAFILRFNYVSDVFAEKFSGNAVVEKATVILRSGLDMTHRIVCTNPPLGEYYDAVFLIVSLKTIQANAIISKITHIHIRLLTTVIDMQGQNASSNDLSGEEKFFLRK